MAIDVPVARRVEEVCLVGEPIALVSEFQRAHLRVDIDGFSTDWVEAVASHYLIESVGYIDAADMPFAGKTEIRRVDGVLLEATDQRWAHQEAVVVVVLATVVIVVGEVQLCVVAVEEEVLAREICQRNMLASSTKYRVQ